ncbi:type II secretion system protein GspM [Limnohabitans sp. 2KL-3]|uniref:type II secretion system protein GspM n=1 Tax=Limnohabitans sp. 2KL-3 TaxID=1100700 RepID=UPI000B1771C8|nr:type II secretion system protein GspM [Limnohabitans sp. 2KL-3]
MSRTHLPLQALQQAWQQRNPREKKGLALVALLLTLTLLWSLALNPAWRTWQQAPAKQAELDRQTQRMRELQAQAKQLQSAPANTAAQARQWLEASVRDLGTGARIQLQGDRATLSVESAPAESMARWLSQARERAQALPVQAQLQQVLPTQKLPPPATALTTALTSPGAAPADANAVHWRGSVVLRLPATP